MRACRDHKIVVVSVLKGLGADSPDVSGRGLIAFTSGAGSRVITPTGAAAGARVVHVNGSPICESRSVINTAVGCVTQRNDELATPHESVGLPC